MLLDCVSSRDQHAAHRIMANPATVINEGADARVPAEEARQRLGELIDRATDGERIVITRNQRDRAVLISMRDYERLRTLDS